MTSMVHIHFRFHKFLIYQMVYGVVENKFVKEIRKLGLFRILADIPDDKYIPPFPFRANNILVFPTGKFETYATLHELRAYGNSKHYKILDSSVYP